MFISIKSSQKNHMGSAFQQVKPKTKQLYHKHMFKIFWELKCIFGALMAETVLIKIKHKNHMRNVCRYNKNILQISCLYIIPPRAVSFSDTRYDFA